MLKWIGCLLVLLAGFAARMLQVSAVRKELQVLSDFVSALDQMEDEIRLNRTPLPRLLARVAVGRNRELEGFFCRISESARRGEYLPETWAREADTLPLTPADLTAVRELGFSLSGDEERACKGIELARKILTDSLSEKRKSRSDREKRSTALCLSAAALLVILLL